MVRGKREHAARAAGVVVALATALAGCGDRSAPATSPAPVFGPTHCGPLPVASRVTEPIELLWGASNVNAALGSGGP